MAIKIKTYASELLLAQLTIPDNLLYEIGEFSKRNFIVDNLCCERCLKAHLLKRAEELNLDKEIIREIKNIKGEIGHMGYYLDENKVTRVET